MLIRVIRGITKKIAAGKYRIFLPQSYEKNENSILLLHKHVQLSYQHFGIPKYMKKKVQYGLNRSFWAFFVLVLFYVNSTFSQNTPYRVKMGKDIGIVVGGLGLTSGAYLWEKHLSPLTPSQIAGLDRNNIPKFDRIASYQWHPTAKWQSDVLLFGSGLAPLALMADKDMRKDWQILGLLGLETFVVNVGITNLVKNAVHRTRPFVYNNNAPMDIKTQQDARLSFFSGHTSTVSSLSFFAAQAFTDYHPHSKALPFIWGTAVALPALTGYLRVRAGKHFPTDVLTGYLIGAAIGVIVPRLHRK